MEYAFETLDVFTERRFGGNPLAVFTDARGLSDSQMQSLAAEMNLSETTFVLPPAESTNTIRLRIFNRTAEMNFAGHPCIGTAYVLASAASSDQPTTMRFEVPAGVVQIGIERVDGEVVGASLIAPQSLWVGGSYAPEEIAACVGILGSEVLTENHPPIAVAMGNPYVVACVAADTLSRCVPDLRAFRDFRTRHPELGDRFSLHLYARDGAELRARMFAPLAGTVEDPATGSANAPLAGLLLSLGTEDHLEFTVRQGEEMGRPSLLHVTATRTGSDITATVAGRCVPVFTGKAILKSESAA